MMVFFQYIYYFIRSLWLRGPYHTFRLLYFEGRYEKTLRLKTAQIVNLNDLTLAGVNSSQNHHYQGASYYVLFHVFKQLPSFLYHSDIIDYGCGKGRALFVAEQCGFKRLIGLDIAKELIDAALNNETQYAKKNNDSSFLWIQQDATLFAIPEQAQVFYFFNPFGKNIMETVLNNILNSYEKHPRDIYIIYLNPKFKEVFFHPNIKLFYTLKHFRYTEGLIYKIEG